MEDPVTQLLVAVFLVVFVVGSAVIGFVIAMRQKDPTDRNSGSKIEPESRYESLSSFHPPPPRTPGIFPTESRQREEE